MEPKHEFLLSMFFTGKVKELSLHVLGKQLVDKEGKELLKHYEHVKKYIKVDTVEIQIIKECFNKYFVIDNIYLPLIKEHLIKELSGIIDFEYKYGGLFYKGESINTWNWDKVYGGRQWECFPRTYAETVLYNGDRNSYENGRKNYQQYGIEVFGGGTVADYINTGMCALKPHVLELLEVLKNE